MVFHPYHHLIVEDCVSEVARSGMYIIARPGWRVFRAPKLLTGTERNQTGAAAISSPAATG
jgi:hypothetical protein